MTSSVPSLFPPSPSGFHYNHVPVVEFMIAQCGVILCENDSELQTYPSLKPSPRVGLVQVRARWAGLELSEDANGDLLLGLDQT